MKTTQKLILAAGFAATLLSPKALLRAAQEPTEINLLLGELPEPTEEPIPWYVPAKCLTAQLMDIVKNADQDLLEKLIKFAEQTIQEKYTFDDNVIKGDKRTLNIPAGKTFTLKLRENFTTGYHFGTPLTGEAVELVSSEHIQDPAPADYCGVGGTRIFTFKALKKGSYVVAIPQVTPSRENPVHAYPFMVVIE